MEKNTVMMSSLSSFALLMAPDKYCISISSIACVLAIMLIKSATLPDCLEESAAAMVFGTKFSSAMAALTFFLVSSLTLG